MPTIASQMLILTASGLQIRSDKENNQARAGFLLLFDTQANKFERDSPAGYKKKRKPLQLP